MTEILIKAHSGSWKRTEEIDQTTNMNSISIGYFIRSSTKSGTGFIVKVLPIHALCALILTAAYNFISSFQYEPEVLDFIIEEEVYQARPIRKTLNWDNESLFCVRISGACGLVVYGLSVLYCIWK